MNVPNYNAIKLKKKNCFVFLLKNFQTELKCLQIMRDRVCELV